MQVVFCQERGSPWQPYGTTRTSQADFNSIQNDNLEIAVDRKKLSQGRFTRSIEMIKIS